MTNDELNIRIANALDKIGLGEYAWDPAEKCPQGHRQDDYNPGIGQMCVVCIDLYFVGRDKSIPPIIPDQYCIGRMPKDFRAPAVVFLALEAWMKSKRRAVDFEIETKHNSFLVTITEYDTNLYTQGVGSTLISAYANAWLGLLELHEEEAIK